MHIVVCRYSAMLLVLISTTYRVELPCTSTMYIVHHTMYSYDVPRDGGPCFYIYLARSSPPHAPKRELQKKGVVRYNNELCVPPEYLPVWAQRAHARARTSAQCLHVHRTSVRCTSYSYIVHVCVSHAHTYTHVRAQVHSCKYPGVQARHTCMYTGT